MSLSCEKDEDSLIKHEDDNPTKTTYVNPPYPVDTDTLRILVLGNSFSTDAMTYMDTLVKASTIDEETVCIYEGYLTSASFNTWTELLLNEEPVTIYRRAGRIAMSTNETLRQLLNQPWDVIVIQQASRLSYIWDSYAILGKYIELLTSSCPNKNVCLAFHMIWSHKPSEMPHLLQGNIECYQKMATQYGINVIIPTGTAIQLARGTHLNDAAYMTRDNWHLNLGMACYIASCTWFEALLRPVFRVSCIGNTARPQPDYSDADILLGQQCAERAVMHPFEVEWKGENN